MAIGAVVVALQAAAAEIPFDVATVDVGTADTPWAVAVADLDGDGDLDVVSASQADDEVNWYESDGAATPSFTPHNITSSPDGPSSLFVADLDADGDLDVVVAAVLDDTITWYESDGAATPGFTARGLATAVGAARPVFVADVDGDGHLDVLAASEADNEVLWYESDGASPPGFTEHVVDAAAPGATSVSAADVDGDGDTDVFATADGDDALSWYESDGASPPAFTKRLVSNLLQGPIWNHPADIDGDGDIDVAAASQVDNTVSWYENDGSTPPVWTRRVLTTTANGVRSVTAADADGDGDVDLFSASEFDDTVRWFESDGASPPTFTVRTVFAAALGASSVATGDVDGDGDLDVVSSSFDDDHLRWYPNESIHRSARFGATSTVATGTAPVGALAAADVDRDGDADLVAALPGDGMVTWYDNDGSGTPGFTARVVGSGATGAVGVDVADLDGDGDADPIAAVLFDGEVLWYENDGGTPPGFTERSVAALNAASEVRAADLDGDGDGDVVAASFTSGLIRWYESDGGAPPGFTDHAVGAASEVLDLDVADLDGDGDLDVLSASQGDDTIAWFESDGAAPPGFTKRVISSSALGASGVHAADVDRDGDLDVVSASQDDDTIAWYESDGASPPAFTQRVVATDAAGAWSVRALDADADGDVDLLAAEAGAGVVLWYESDGASPPVFDVRTLAAGPGVVRALAAADLDGDGRRDVASAWAGTVVWQREAGGQFALDTQSTAGPLLIEGGTHEVLRFDLDHLGRAGDTDLELASVALRFEKSGGVPLVDAEFNALVSAVQIYADDGSGVLETGTDALVGNLVGPIQLTNGVHEIAMPDGSADVQLGQGASRRFFVVLVMKSDASTAPIDVLRIAHVTENTSTAEDRDNDLPLALAAVDDVETALLSVVPSIPPCADGVDNDGDLLTDFPDDPGCADASYDSREDPECDDGIDNDGDSATDYGGDLDCYAGPSWDDESAGPPLPSCGLGFELGLLLPPLQILRRRRRRHRRTD